MPESAQPTPLPTRLLKIGGSLLTRRGTPFQVATAQLAAIAGEIADSPASGLVIVHGLGTFGRAVMPLYDSDHIDGRRSHLGRRVLRVLAELHDHVVDALDSAGVPVSPLDAATLFGVDGRAASAVQVSTDSITAHLRAGRVPVLHGGTLLALDGDFAMVSSDVMTVELARALGAVEALWATDVDGVLDRDRRLLPSLSHETGLRLWQPAEAASDPSGAMHGKLAEALRLADDGIPSLIVNGTVPGRIKAALQGTPVLGTTVVSRTTLHPHHSHSKRLIGPA
jgi:isopentenyl phosphate kinase